MQIRSVFKSILLLAVIGLGACTKKSECGTASGACNDVVPTDEACMAYFQRWFYSSSSNTCTLMSYSGCSQKGFATEAECNVCKCKKK